MDPGEWRGWATAQPGQQARSSNPCGTDDVPASGARRAATAANGRADSGERSPAIAYELSDQMFPAAGSELA
jgi:hypothetical protein